MTGGDKNPSPTATSLTKILNQCNKEDMKIIFNKLKGIFNNDNSNNTNSDGEEGDLELIDSATFHIETQDKKA